MTDRASVNCPEDHGLDSKVIDSSAWNGISRWYWELASERMQATTEVAQMAREDDRDVLVVRRSLSVSRG